MRAVVTVLIFLAGMLAGVFLGMDYEKTHRPFDYPTVIYSDPVGCEPDFEELLESHDMAIVWRAPDGSIDVEFQHERR